MEKRRGVFLAIAAFAVTGAFLFAQEEVTGAKASVTLDFNASLLSADTDGNVESMTDAGFGGGGDSTLSARYENAWFGGTASIGFGDILKWLASGEGVPDAGILSIEELYAWVKPFGEHFKFTAGIFENKDGVNSYTGDIDNFDMGVFFDGSESEWFYTEPMFPTKPSLFNGLLSEATFGPITVQFLYAPNLSDKAGVTMFAGDMSGQYDVMALQMGLPPGNYVPPDDAGGRFYRLGGRLIVRFPEIVTISALFKLDAYPTEIFNDLFTQLGFPLFPGTAGYNITFGAYADITAIENLGVSLGYTGFTMANDDGGAKAALWNGIDLRAAWTGIPGLSVSTHNNVSFASGGDWLFFREDSKFLTLYNAVGLTKELNDKFSVNGEAGNTYSKTDVDDGRGAGLVKIAEVENVWGQVKLISRLAEDTEFSAGLRVDYAKTELYGENDSVTVFSVPVGVKVSF